MRTRRPFEDFLHSWGGPAVALWGTVLLALLAGAILLSLVQPWVIAGDPFRLLHRSPTALMHPLRTDDQHRP